MPVSENAAITAFLCRQSLVVEYQRVLEVASTLAQILQKILHIVEMFFFFAQNMLHGDPRRRVVITRIPDDVVLALYGNSFRKQILAKHIQQGLAFHVLRMAARRQTFRVEVRFAAQLGNPLRCDIGMGLLFLCVFQKLCGYCVCLNPGSHIVMPLVA
jgi:hypothetical protein